MENVLVTWQQIETEKYPKLMVEASLCDNAYDQTGLKAPSRARKGQTTKIATMPDTEPSMCLIGRCLSTRMGIMIQDLVKTTKKLIAANGEHIELDSTLFRTLTLGDSTSSKLVYVTNQATCLLLSQKARKELRARPMEFPAQVQRPAQWLSTQTWTLKTTAARTMTAPPHQKHHDSPRSTHPSPPPATRTTDPAKRN